MKNLIILLSLIISVNCFGQEIKIQTSAECNDCKVRLEDKLNYTKGVKFAELDLETKIIVVGYSEKKITSDEIKKIISELGYDADDVKANPEAYEKLPACCKVGGMEHH